MDAQNTKKPREGGKITVWFFPYREQYEPSQTIWQRHIYEGQTKCENCGVRKMFNTVTDLLEFFQEHKECKEPSKQEP